jgi:hypothetical protein
VEILWTIGEYPVDEATRRSFFVDAIRVFPPRGRARALLMRFRTPLRLFRTDEYVEFSLLTHINDGIGSAAKH